MNGFDFAVVVDGSAVGWDDVRLDAVSLAAFEEDFEGTQLARDVTVRGVLGALAAADNVRVSVARGPSGIHVRGYLADWYAYCVWVEGILFLLGAAQTIGATARGALFADDGAYYEYPIYALYDVSSGRVTVQRRATESDGEERTRELLAAHGLTLP